MMALTVALVGETVTKESTGSAMGLLGTMSAIGTTLGPSLGGVLIAGPGWRFIFLVNVPLGILNVLLAHRYLPVDRREPKTDWAGFDTAGTLLIALTLGANALAMTMGRGRFGPLNMALLLVTVGGAGLFVVAEARAASPLMRLNDVPQPKARHEPRHEHARLDGGNGNAGGRAVLSLSGARVGCGCCRNRHVGRSIGRRADRRTGRSRR